MKWIIIEGADGTGKSTLIKGLLPDLEYRNTPTWHSILVPNFSYPSEMSKEMNLAYARGEYEASIRIFKQLIDKFHIICDRFHLGEFTYGQVKRGYRRTEAFETIVRIEWQIIKQFGWPYLKDDFSLIVLTGEQNDILNRASKVKQYPAPHDLIKILESYEHVYHLSILPKILINTTQMDIDTTTKIALDFIFKRVRP